MLIKSLDEKRERLVSNRARPLSLATIVLAILILRS
jgi:hypothetical protein